jgi:hypothetical protein
MLSCTASATGRGGVGGAFAMRSAEQRAAHAAGGEAAQVEAGDDGNDENCALCGVGGSLLCCDACPAAYHLRCIGETSR